MCGAENVYTRNTLNRIYTGGWGYKENLDNFFGMLGIMIYILINVMSFLLYNYLVKKFRDYSMITGKIVFIIYSILVNVFMLALYSGLFGHYYFENSVLEFINLVVVKFGFITFPIVFTMAYILIKKKNC